MASAVPNDPAPMTAVAFVIVRSLRLAENKKKAAVPNRRRLSSVDGAARRCGAFGSLRADTLQMLEVERVEIDRLQQQLRKARALHQIGNRLAPEREQQIRAVRGGNGGALLVLSETTHREDDGLMRFSTICTGMTELGREPN